jgi:hypothetical protein
MNNNETANSSAGGHGLQHSEERFRLLVEILQVFNLAAK